MKEYNGYKLKDGVLGKVIYSKPSVKYLSKDTLEYLRLCVLEMGPYTNFNYKKIAKYFGVKLGRNNYAHDISYFDSNTNTIYLSKAFFQKDKYHKIEVICHEIAHHIQIILNLYCENKNVLSYKVRDEQQAETIGQMLASMLYYKCIDIGELKFDTYFKIEDILFLKRHYKRQGYNLKDDLLQKVK